MPLNRQALKDLGSTASGSYERDTFSPDECRKIDPTLAPLSDAELTAVIELLSALAELAVEDCIKEDAPGSKYPRGVVHFPDGPSTIET